MAITLHWFLPTNGDSRTRSQPGQRRRRHREPGDDQSGAARPPDIDYIGLVARAAESLGFTGGADTDEQLVRGRLGAHRGADAA